MALDKKLEDTLKRIAKRYDLKQPRYVAAGIKDPDIAQYASYVEYGWVQKVNAKQHYGFFKPRLGENAPPIGATLFCPPRPFLGATYDYYRVEWFKLMASLLWYRKSVTLENGLSIVGQRMVEDIQKTIIDRGTPTVKFAKRSPLTMALYAYRAKGHKLDKTPGNIKTDEPLILTGNMLASITYELE